MIEKFIEVIVCPFVDWSLGGLMLMFAANALHHDAHAVPPIGFWAGFFVAGSVMTIARLTVRGTADG